MADEDYEMIPHQLLSDLKYEVEALKKKLIQPDTKANELILEMESLKDSLHELTEAFQKALSEIKEEGDASISLKSLKEQLNSVVTQNETIAKGMVAISDKLEDFMRQASPKPVAQLQQSSSPFVNQSSSPFPSMPSFPQPHPMGVGPLPLSPSRMAPMPVDNAIDDFPPPPPGVAKKRIGPF